MDRAVVPVSFTAHAWPRRPRRRTMTYACSVLRPGNETVFGFCFNEIVIFI